MRQNIFFLFFLILLLPTASAQFLAFGDTSITAEQCEIVSKNVTIQNTKAQTHNYALSVGGSGSDFVTFSQIAFSLTPQNHTRITTFYTIPCDAKPKTYPVSIYFDDGADELELYQELEVIEKPAVLIDAVPASHVITPCAEAEFNMNFTNPSNFTDIISLSATGHENILLSPDTIVLKAEESKQATLKVTPEDCTESGTFPITLIADSQKTEKKTELELEVVITSTGIAQLAEEVTKIKTGYNDSTAELTIKNVGDKQTTYTIAIDGAEFASVDPASITLEPNEESKINLRLNPGEDTPEGEQGIELTATVDETGVVYSKELIVELSKPNFIQRNPIAFAIILVVIAFLIVGAVLLVMYTRTDSYKQKKQERKERREQRKQERKERALARREKRKERAARRKAERERRRKEKEERKARRRQERQDRKASTQAFKTKKQVTRKERKAAKKAAKRAIKTGKAPAEPDYIIGARKSKKKPFILSALVVLILIIILAFWNFIAPNIIYVGIGILILAALLLAKKIVRSSAFTKSWKLVPAKQEQETSVWKKGLRKLIISSDKAIKYYQIRVSKRKNKDLQNAAVLQTFNILQNAPAKITAEIAVPKKFLNKHKIDLSELKVGKYVNYNWRSQKFEKAGEDLKFVYIKANLKEGTYSIYAKLPKKKPREISKKRIIITGLVLLGLIVMFAVTLIHPNTVQGAIPAQTWKQDTVHKLYLGDYFSDPDGEKLTYSAEGNDKITIDFVENTAIFTPQTGFTGEERVKFTATDASGAAVTGNTVPLRVRKVLVPWYFQPILSVILAVLAVLVLIWMVVKLKKHN